MTIVDILINVVLSYFGCIGFAILVNVPRKILLVVGIDGVLGWMSYLICFKAGLGMFTSNFIGALVIGLCSSFLAYYMKKPIINFNIPALITLVPGYLAYEAVRDIVFKGVSTGMNTTLKVMVVTLALSVGIMLSQLFVTGLKSFFHYIKT